MRYLVQIQTDAGFSFEARFKTSQEANNWISNQEGKPHRLPERWCKESLCTEDEINSSSDSQINEEGETEYLLPKTFDVTVTDLGDQPQWDEVRAKRDKIIETTRWIKQRHSDEQELGLTTTLSGAKFNDWLNYWQELRDIPQQQDDPNNIVWPQQPSTE
jgi:hypothetical protein